MRFNKILLTQIFGRLIKQSNKGYFFECTYVNMKVLLLYVIKKIIGTTLMCYV